MLADELFDGCARRPLVAGVSPFVGKRLPEQRMAARQQGDRRGAQRRRAAVGAVRALASRGLSRAQAMRPARHSSSSQAGS